MKKVRIGILVVVALMLLGYLSYNIVRMVPGAKTSGELLKYSYITTSIAENIHNKPFAVEPSARIPALVTISGVVTDYQKIVKTEISGDWKWTYVGYSIFTRNESGEPIVARIMTGVQRYWKEFLVDEYFLPDPQMWWNDIVIVESYTTVHKTGRGELRNAEETYKSLTGIQTENGEVFIKPYIITLIKSKVYFPCSKRLSPPLDNCE